MTSKSEKPGVGLWFKVAFRPGPGGYVFFRIWADAYLWPVLCNQPARSGLVRQFPNEFRNTLCSRGIIPGIDRLLPGYQVHGRRHGPILGKLGAVWGGGFCGPDLVWRDTGFQRPGLDRAAVPYGGGCSYNAPGYSHGLVGADCDLFRLGPPGQG